MNSKRKSTNIIVITKLDGTFTFNDIDTHDVARDYLWVQVNEDHQEYISSDDIKRIIIYLKIEEEQA